jgi:hypothetical protein
VKLVDANTPDAATLPRTQGLLALDALSADAAARAKEGAGRHKPVVRTTDAPLGRMADDAAPAGP